MLCRPRYVKKIGHTADCQSQRVIGNIALRDHLSAVSLVKCARATASACTVPPGQPSLFTYTSRPACLCCVLELRRMGSHAAGTKSLPSRLPDMGGVTVNQPERRPTGRAFATTESGAERCCQF